jgi:serine/threonine protein kinase
MTSKTFPIRCWINGKPSDSQFKINYNKESITDLKRLKDQILSSYNFENTVNHNKMIIYNYKGIQIDDDEVPYLNENTILYISIDGNKFNNSNYYHQYEIIKSLKSGGYAEVILAKNILNDEKVSIKKTDLKNFQTEELYNISREAVIINSLIHKNIVKILNTFTYDDSLYMVMEYCEGGELSSLIDSPEPIEENYFKKIFQQIHSAVRFMHSKNIVHRDLKPNNILFKDKERTEICIIDFGISGNSNGLSSEIIRAGTVKYCSPELVSGEHFQSSIKIDIWSLGVILYLMWYKMFPFDGATDEKVSEKIANEDVCFPKNVKIKKSLADLIEGCLRKNPKRRIDCNDKLFENWYNDQSNVYYDWKEKIKNPFYKNNVFNGGKYNSVGNIKTTSYIKKKLMGGNNNNSNSPKKNNNHNFSNNKTTAFNSKKKKNKFYFLFNKI